MTAVEDLNALVATDGYTEADLVALKMLAGAGVDAEAAALVILVARRQGVDPIVLARAAMGQGARLRWAREES